MHTAPIAIQSYNAPLFDRSRVGFHRIPRSTLRTLGQVLKAMAILVPLAAAGVARAEPAHDLPAPVALERSSPDGIHIGEFIDSNDTLRGLKAV